MAWTLKKNCHWKFYDQICACKLVTSLTISLLTCLGRPKEKRCEVLESMQEDRCKCSPESTRIRTMTVSVTKEVSFFGYTLQKSVKIRDTQKVYIKSQCVCSKNLCEIMGGAFWDAPHFNQEFSNPKTGIKYQGLINTPTLLLSNPASPRATFCMHRPWDWKKQQDHFREMKGDTF